MAKNLNNIYGYQSRAIRYDANDIDTIRNNRITNGSDWKKNCFALIKQRIRQIYYENQNRRCAYCRRTLNNLGFNEHIDHVLHKDRYYRWMFNPKNLVLTCKDCNPLKGTEDTKSPTHDGRRFPNSKTGFTIFNPHFERWENCFEIEDNMFLRGRSIRGDRTIQVCKLYKDIYIIRFAQESGVFAQSAIKRAVKKQRLFSVGSVEYQACQKVIDHYTKLI